MTKIDDFKEYARKRIAEHMLDGRKKSNGEVKIKAYDGEDSFYSGSDEEYREFLDGLDAEMSGPSPVKEENLYEGETINIRDVIDKVKEKTVDAAAKAAIKTGDVISKLKPRESEIPKACPEKASDEIVSDISKMKNAITDTMNDSMDKIDGLDERLGNVSDSFEDVIKKISEINETVSKIDERIEEIETQTSNFERTSSINDADLKQEINEIKAISTQIRDMVNGVSKLSDSVFDMKNAQQNTKTALNDLSIAFRSLRKKTIAGIVIISIISFIAAALGVINLLA